MPSIHWQFPLQCTTFALIVLNSAPALSDIARSLLGGKLERSGGDRDGTGEVDRQVYHDQDGTATPESAARYSVKWQLVVATVACAAGTALSLATAVTCSTQLDVGQRRIITEWVAFASWACVALQTGAILADRRPISRYRLAVLSATSQAFLALGTYATHNIWHWPHPGAKSSPASALLPNVAFVFAVVGASACLALPRRPDVYYAIPPSQYTSPSTPQENGAVTNGKASEKPDLRAVDRESSTSALGFVFFTWYGYLLKKARTGTGVLELYHLPWMEANTRARFLYDSFVGMSKAEEDAPGAEGEKKKPKSGTKLAWSMLRYYWRTMALQYLLTLVQGVFMVAPQFMLYRLLRILEDRGYERSASAQLAPWVAGLGLTILLSALSESWMWHISFRYLHVRIRMQLAALIFAKSMRRKDARGAKKSGDEGESDAGSAESGEESAEELVQKTRQGTVNLVGVDTKRVADFSDMQNWFFGSVVKIALSFILLGQLIGWQALLAGFIAQLITVPANYYSANIYTQGQSKVMEWRDRKLAVLNEVLSGIRQVKFSALEKQTQERISKVREEELAVLWKTFMADIVLVFCWIVGPIMLSAVSLAVYAIIYGSLSASIAFTTIGVLQSLQVVLGFMPELMTLGFDAWVSLKRIDDYLQGPEKPVNTVPGDSVTFEKCTVAWPSDDEKDENTFMLRELSIEFPNGELSVVSGRTGSGKSLLLSAILGEADVLSGTIKVPRAPSIEERFDAKANKDNWIIPSAMAFVGQQPWIENGSFRENVLFGLPYDADRYAKVVQACALAEDLKILTDGDSTEIGHNGVNISGGQKWRITLARALYSRAGILVLDDIFSAVDTHVGRHIFENALTGELAQGRTRILVTHHVSLALPRTKYTVLLGDGGVEQCGFIADLERTGKLQEILEEKDEEADSGGGSAMESGDEDAEGPTTDGAKLRRVSTSRRSKRESFPALEQVRSRASQRSRKHSISKGRIDASADVVARPAAQPKKFVEDETKMAGRVSFTVYLKYIRASGGLWIWLLIGFVFTIYEGLELGKSYWITLWTQSYEADSTSKFVTMSKHAQGHLQFQQPFTGEVGAVAMDDRMKYFLGIYFAISIVMSLEGTLRFAIVYVASIRASRRLFDDLTYHVLRAPLRWLDTVPIGRVLNRFTADFAVVDSELSFGLTSTLFSTLSVLGICVAGIIISPIVVIFAVVLLVVSGRFALYYLDGAREAKRLESLAKSPIFDAYNAALGGVSTIRAFCKTEVYIESMYRRIDIHGQTIFYTWGFNRWLTARLGIVGAIFVIAMTAVVVTVPGVDAPLAGFALSFALTYTESIFWLLRQYANVELGMNATERIVEYSEMPTETEAGRDAPAAWPTDGRIEVHDLVAAYAPELAPVLHGLTFSVNPGERCAVVGRTGAGKSSLTLALFRFLDQRGGSIHIDGIDISQIKLHDLRSRLSIIPQDPILFSGTVRSNLDPFDEHADDELRDALRRVHLILDDAESPPPTASGSDSPNSPGARTPARATNTNPFASLRSPIAEGGQNLSQGQRQLLCLARAIVSRPRILVLDEATSAVDRETDALIQRSIREGFRGATLLVIAHRLSTVADFDRVVVLGEGKVVESGPPVELWGREGGAFRGMVEDSGEREALREIMVGGKGE